jgi:hypothetical protein
MLYNSFCFRNEKKSNLFDLVLTGSKFYENERQKEEQMKRRIEEQRQKINQISMEQLRHGTIEVRNSLSALFICLFWPGIHVFFKWSKMEFFTRTCCV